MRLNASELAREAAATGFQVEPLEKAILLLELLESIRSHPFLRDRLALKGGTAFNLFLFAIPRLSVDIDLNYVGAIEREAMIAERPAIEQALAAASSRAGAQPRRIPTDHAGGKWRLSHVRAAGGTGTVEIDVNFMLRAPLWPVARMDSRPLGGFAATGIPVLDIHELVAGKLSALLARTAVRDVFDASRAIRVPDLEPAKLRLAFVVYGGISRKDWRGVSIDDVSVDEVEADRTLFPLLRDEDVPPKGGIADWTRALVSDCRALLSIVLPLTAAEHEFIRRLNDLGEIVPDLLTGDERMQKVIRTHPGLWWKAQNVRRFRGLDTGPPPIDIV